MFRSVGRAVVLSLLFATMARAQGVLGVDPTGRSGDRPALPPPAQTTQPPAAPMLPPLSEIENKKAENFPPLRVFVREVRVTGSTVFSAEELAQVTKPYTNREISSVDLEALRRALTQLYVRRGYVTSGAVIPDQRIGNGVLQLNIIEGKLAGIEVESIGRSKWLRPSFIEKRLALGTESPVNRETLAERLQLLQQNDVVQRVQAELKPGLKLGESILHVAIEEQRPYSLTFGFNNYQSPTVGAERGLVSLRHRNLTGFGDALSVTYGQSDGVEPQLDASYAFPLTARDTTLMLRYRKNDFTVIEAPFEPLEVKSESEIYGITLRHPLYRTLQRDVVISLAGEHLRNKTFLLGEPFSFSPGARNGKSVVSALRVAVEWTEQTPEQVLAARSQFSIGLDVLGATNNAARIADSQFFAWLGQVQWARRWRLRNIQTIARVDVQLTPNPLLSLEQIAVGGRYSVRGYRENQFVRDNGLSTSLEARIPIFYETRRWAETLDLAPFVDVGRAWNVNRPGAHPETIASIGVGLRWGTSLALFSHSWHPLTLAPQFEIYWGHQLHDVKTSGGNLQDEGVHLQLLLSVL